MTMKERLTIIGHSKIQRVVLPSIFKAIAERLRLIFYHVIAEALNKIYRYNNSCVISSRIARKQNK